jgi:hypothetical protein
LLENEINYYLIMIYDISRLEAFVNERLPSEVLESTELYNLTLEEVSEEESEALEKGAEVRVT